MHVLVTGGLGFVGYAVAYTLAETGHQVTVLARPRPERTGPELPAGVEIVYADIRDADAVRTGLVGRGIEGVCHLAALTRVRDSFEHPLDYFDVNVGGTLNLLRALEATTEQPPSFVLASTGAVYGSKVEGKLTEDLPALPDNPYTASKRAAEQLVEYHAKNGAIGATILRCFGISGACNGVGDTDTTRIIPKALRVAAGSDEFLAVNGDGTALRDFTHVVDVADCFQLALHTNVPGQPPYYNVGTGQGATIKDVIAAVEEVSNQPVAIKTLPAKPEASTLIADTSNVRGDLHWSPQRTSLLEIVRDAWHAIPTESTTLSS